MVVAWDKSFITDRGLKYPPITHKLTVAYGSMVCPPPAPSSIIKFDVSFLENETHLEYKLGILFDLRSILRQAITSNIVALYALSIFLRFLFVPSASISIAATTNAIDTKKDQCTHSSFRFLLFFVDIFTTTDFIFANDDDDDGTDSGKTSF
jgi:hypothetical protein